MYGRNIGYSIKIYKIKMDWECTRTYNPRWNYFQRYFKQINIQCIYSCIINILCIILYVYTVYIYFSKKCIRCTIFVSLKSPLYSSTEVLWKKKKENNKFTIVHGGFRWNYIEILNNNTKKHAEHDKNYFAALK